MPVRPPISTPHFEHCKECRRYEIFKMVLTHCDMNELSLDELIKTPIELTDKLLNTFYERIDKAS